MSVLQDLWYGNLRPSENRKISEEEKNLLGSMVSQQQRLFTSLKDKERI